MVHLSTRTVFALLFLTSFSVSLFAQAPATEWCGTKEISPWLTNWYATHRKSVAERNADTAWLFVPVTIHILGNNAGTGYFPTDQAIRAVCEMNGRFEKARIHFYLMPGDPIRYVNNTKWYSHDYDGGEELITTNNLPDRLNAYVVQNPAGACGYSWYDAIVLGKNCSEAGNSTWSHEAGHHLSLPHPFYGWEGYTHNYTQPAPKEIRGRPVEKMGQSNCYGSGDLFCDTRPDYLNYRWSCNGDRESTQVQRDPDGTAFRSDATLIMGYSLDACTARFTEEQIAAMRENLRTEHASYLQIDERLPQIADDAVVSLISPLDTVAVQYNKVVLQWAPVENANFYSVEVSRQPNFYIISYRATVYNTTELAYPKPMINNNVLYWRVRAYGEDDLCQPNENMQTGVFRTRNFNATVTGLNELEELLETEIAPNPVSPTQQAIFSVSAAASMEVQLQIRDAAGRLCRSMTVQIAAGENNVALPTESLQAGMYAVSLLHEKGVVTRRLTVQ